VGWNGACEEYDMELFDQMIASLSAEYCIDADRIFAAGFSWGGDMCQALACCRGETVRAIAPASGPELFPSIYPEACPETDRPAFRMTYATNDAYPPQMFADTIEWHRTQQSCSNDAIDIEPPPCIAYEGCEDPVIACEYEGLGHAWPSDWAESTWSFFSQFQ
jgi:polyhydroxybutyrate depolymerase